MLWTVSAQGDGGAAEAEASGCLLIWRWLASRGGDSSSDSRSHVVAVCAYVCVLFRCLCICHFERDVGESGDETMMLRQCVCDRFRYI